MILLLAGKDLNKEAFNQLSKQLETLIFYYIVTKTPTKELERKFSKWSKDLRNISKNTKDHEVELNKFINSNLKPEIETKERLFEISFKEFNYKTLQQYRLKYILSKFAKYIELRALNQEEPESLDNYIKSKIQIEHILPNNPKPELKFDFESKSGQNTYDTYKLKLGNLTLLEQPINGAIGRDYYNIKKEAYKKSTILMTKSIAVIENVGKDTAINRINQELKSFDTWGKKEIDERQDLMFNLAKKIWSVDISG